MLILANTLLLLHLYTYVPSVLPGLETPAGTKALWKDHHIPQMKELHFVLRSGKVPRAFIEAVGAENVLPV